MAYFRCGGGGGAKVYLDGKEVNENMSLVTNYMDIKVSTLPYSFGHGSAVVLNNEIHILGSSSTNYKTKHYKWNGSSWTSESTLPYGFYNGSVVVLNNEIHILGSASTYEERKHYKWNGSSWTRVSTLPWDFGYGSAVVLNNENHILGGYGSLTNHYIINMKIYKEVV